MEAAEYDLIVAGAGPAGSACGIVAARAGASVLLLEKENFPRHKVCGEFVSPESLGLLEWLLGGARFQSKPAVGASRLFYRNRTARLPIDPPARSISRAELDLELLRAARRAGARAEEGVTIRKVEPDGMFTVTAGNEKFRARAVVNATGRWSQLGRHAPGTEKWIGIKAHFSETAPPASVDLYFFDGGYCGVTPLDGGSINACALVRASVARSFDDVLALHPELWRRSRGWRPLFAPLTTSGLRFHEPVTESEGMLLAGDAACFIDPYTGDGISLALHSGAMAAQALLPFFAGNRSLENARACYRAEYFRHLSPAFRNSAWIRRVLTTPPWIKSVAIGIAGMAPVARALVRGTRVRGKTGIGDEPGK